MFQSSLSLVTPASTDKASPGGSMRRCGTCRGSPGSEESQQRAGRRLRCLGAKFSLALFWVTTFTMFLHPESFRLPARLRCFQLMNSHAYLTTGLVQGLPSSLIAALQHPPTHTHTRCLAGCPLPRAASMGSLLLRCSWAFLP